ncbi:MAG: aldehyde dehydrogenase family protein, partial [Deltaproteobacteria bacterium]|nr:aldehyde dehydrogenase family protein [Deltaproteobacteria bacterium]
SLGEIERRLAAELHDDAANPSLTVAKDGFAEVRSSKFEVRSEGYFIPPTIIADVKPGSRIEQEEIFGPVLAVIKAKDFDHAVEIANDTEYGLTGAVYTQNRDKIEKAKLEFHVGNLYVNRKCTGAMVCCHPFGGFNMSGTCSKAGGRDYLFLFMQSKAIGEVVGKGIGGRP